MSLRYEANEALRSISAAMPGLQRMSAATGERADAPRENFGAKAFLNNASWEFVDVVENPSRYISIRVAPTKPQFEFNESPAFEIILSNRSGDRVPLGSPGLFSNVIYLYGWSIGQGDSVTFKRLVHSDLTNFAVDLGELFHLEES